MVVKASPKCSSRVPDRSFQHTTCCGKPKPVKWAIAQTCACLSVLQRYFWITGCTYAKATNGEVISFLSTVVWSRAPFQIHGSSAFTYMRNELTIPLTKDVPKTHRTLKKIIFFQISFPWFANQPLVPSGDILFTCFFHSRSCFRKRFYFLWSVMPSIHHSLYIQVR